MPVISLSSKSYILMGFISKKWVWQGISHSELIIYAKEKHKLIFFGCRQTTAVKKSGIDGSSAHQKFL